MKQKIIINFVLQPTKTTIDYFYKNCFFDIFKNFGVKTYFFYNSSNIDFLEELNKNYNDFGIYFQNFLSINELIEKTKIFEIIEATTFTEGIIPILHKFKKVLGQEISNEIDVFRNKKIQRELLLNYDKTISINYKKFDNINSLNLNLILKDFEFPFIIKPVFGIQSQLVYKVKNEFEFEIAKKSIIDSNKNHLQNLNSSDKIQFLIEEFIDGEMYSIDYFVDKNQNIFLLKPIKVFLGTDLNVNDFMNYNRVSGSLFENDLINYDLEGFIKKNIQATNIKGTFIHHEFKLNSKFELKTIELNGRIGGYRLEMYFESYNFNMFRFLFGENLKTKNGVNMSIFLVYSKKRGILKGFNYELIEKVKQLKSFFNIKIYTNLIGKEVGLTKDGFPKSMIIKLKNISNDEILKDIKFIENNYFDFLEVE